MTSTTQSWPELHWKAIGGWPGGTVTAVALSPDFIEDRLALAGTQAGIFLSMDGGGHWQRSDVGLADPQVNSTLLVATDGGVAGFVATQSGHLYQRSFATTATPIPWQPVTGWAGFGVIQALVASPTYTQDQTLFAATGEGIFRSQDGGASWESSTFGLLDLDILCLACAPTYAESQLLWAGSAGGGLYRSRNGARSWRDSGIGLPDSALQSLLVSPTYAADETLFVGTENDGIYFSTDGSATWSPLSSDLAGLPINCMARSRDGQLWIAGTGKGIRYSHDGGARWHGATASDSDSDQADTLFMALAVALADDGRALAGTFLDGLIRSVDGGATWAVANSNLVAHAPPLSRLTPTGQLFALDGDGLLATISLDRGAAGAEWQPLNHLFNDEALITLGATPLPDGPLLLMTATDLYWRSIEGANEEEVWHAIPLPPHAEDLVLLSTSPAFLEDHTLWLGNGDGAIQHSTDGGQRWQQLTVPWQSAALLQLLCSPFYERDQLLYAVTSTPLATELTAATQLTVWQGQQGGTSWVALADLQSESAAVALTLPLDPVEAPLLLATQNRCIKLYQAPVAATAQEPQVEWTVTQSFLPETVRITGIVTTANYLEDHLVYLTTTQGIYVACDRDEMTGENGVKWQRAWPEIADQTIVGLHCIRNGKPLYAVALGGTIWQASP